MRALRGKGKAQPWFPALVLDSQGVSISPTPAQPLGQCQTPKGAAQRSGLQPSWCLHTGWSPADSIAPKGKNERENPVEQEPSPAVQQRGP